MLVDQHLIVCCRCQFSDYYACLLTSFRAGSANWVKRQLLLLQVQQQPAAGSWVCLLLLMAVCVCGLSGLLAGDLTERETT